VIGGGDWAEDRLLPDAVRAATRGEPLVVRSPRSVRPWQHVLEPLAGYLTLAERLAADPVDAGDGSNFGPTADDAKPVSWVADRLAERWGEAARWERDPAVHPHEERLLQLDASKARARLGWEPRLRLEEALGWTVEWYRAFESGADAASLTLEQIDRYAALVARECA
jgi:CDP-glucose 4,6-dehydratase